MLVCVIILAVHAHTAVSCSCSVSHVLCHANLYMPGYAGIQTLCPRSLCRAMLWWALLVFLFPAQLSISPFFKSVTMNITEAGLVKKKTAIFVGHGLLCTAFPLVMVTWR